MCLTILCKTREERRTLIKNPSVAKEDIKVFKIFRRTSSGELVSPYKLFEYHRGYIYYQEDNNFTFNSERDSFDRSDWMLKINEGLHSYISLEDAENNCNWEERKIIIECIIPKGSLFYKNNREIVSNQLLIPYKTIEHEF